MLTIYHWRSSDRKGEWLTTDQFREYCQSPTENDDVWWIDLSQPTPEEEALVFHKLHPVHTLTLEDITKPRREPEALPHFPKVEEFPDYLFVIVNPLIRIDGNTDPESLRQRPPYRQLSAVIAQTMLITHHYEPLPSTTELQQYLERHGHQAKRGPDYMFHVVLDAMVDEYAPALDGITDRLDSVEDEVFGKASPELLSHMLQLKRMIIALRKTLILEREVLFRLTRGEFRLIDEREVVYYRNVYDHLVRYAELVETSREMATDLMQTHLAAVSNKLNEVMKALAMISTVVLPMTLVAGVYGMNFDHMPEIHWKIGYPMALGLMLLVGVGAFAFFRWRKWI